MSQDWSAEHMDHWKACAEAYRSDRRAVAEQGQMNGHRQQVREEMVCWLNRFVMGEITLLEFNAIFQQKAQHAWSAFGLRGSCGLFLNKLVKYLGHGAGAQDVLRMILPIPHQNHWNHVEGDSACRSWPTFWNVRS